MLAEEGLNDVFVSEIALMVSRAYSCRDPCLVCALAVQSLPKDRWGNDLHLHWKTAVCLTGVLTKYTRVPCQVFEID